MQTRISMTILLAFIMILPVGLRAQATTFVGKLIAADLQIPVASASILVKGTGVGTSTGVDGMFTIKAKPGDVLVFSGIGIYAEMCFNIAEGIHRGWATGSAEEWYIKGIKASHAFYGIREGSNEVSFFKPGGRPTNAADYDKYIVNFNWDAYYTQATVKYEPGSVGLNKILDQKYLAFFQNSGWEAYFNYRRTGVPSFSASGPGTGNSGKIPRRFQYPSSEATTNKTNLDEALSRQYGGKDDINMDMWIVK